MTLTKLTFNLNEFLPLNKEGKTFFDTNGFFDVPHFLHEFIFKAEFEPNFEGWKSTRDTTKDTN